MNAVETPVNELTDNHITNILTDADKLGITAIEWLGGEPLLRDSVFKHMATATELGFRNNMWTGGLPLQKKHIAEQCARFCKKGLISVHVSDINPKTYKILHPEKDENNLDKILKGVKRLLNMGYPAEQMLNSVTYTGLQSADDLIQTIDYFENEFGIFTSLNVYHTYLRPGQDNHDLLRFIPDRRDVSRVYARLKKQYGMNQMPMNCVNLQYCSTTVAVLCDGSVTPCATIRYDKNNLKNCGSFYNIVNESKEELLFMPFKDRENRPEQCRRCHLAEECWGCRSRSYAAGFGIFGPDPRCPKFKSKENYDN